MQTTTTVDNMKEIGVSINNQSHFNASSLVLSIGEHFITQWKLKKERDKLCPNTIGQDISDCLQTIELGKFDLSMFQSINNHNTNTGTTTTTTTTIANTLIPKTTIFGSENNCNYSNTTIDCNSTTLKENCGPECWPAPFGTGMTVVIALFLASCIVMTILGNLLVLISFAVDRRIRQPTNFFIASLAVTDLLIGVISMPFYTLYVLIGYWPDELGPILCDLWLSVDYTVCLVSQFTVLSITTDRFCSVKYPTQYRAWRTSQKITLTLILIWMIPSILFFISIFGWEHFTGHRDLRPGECMVQFLKDPVFNTSLIIVYYWIPLLILILLYFFILRAAWILSQKTMFKEKSRRCVLSQRKSKELFVDKSNTNEDETCGDICLGHPVVPSQLNSLRDVKTQDKETQVSPSKVFEFHSSEESPENLHESHYSQIQEKEKEYDVKTESKTKLFQIHKKFTRDRKERQREEIRVENRAKKALRTISFILGAFVACWTPYHILAILASWNPSSVNISVYMISYFLCYANSPLNPFCYASSNQQFKNAFKRILQGDFSFK